MFVRILSLYFTLLYLLLKNRLLYRGDSLLQLALCSSSGSCPAITENGYDFSQQTSPYSWEITGGNLTFMALGAVVYFSMTMGVEYSLTFPSLLAWFSTSGLSESDINPNIRFEDEDEDVWNERVRLMNSRNSTDIIELKGLRKVYIDFYDRLIHIITSFCATLGGKRTYEMLSGSSTTKMKVAVQSLCFGVPKGQCFGFLGIYIISF